MLVATDRRGLVKIGAMLKWYSAQAWVTASGIIDAFPNKPFNVIVRSSTPAPHFTAKHRQIAAALPPLSATIHIIYDEPSPYNSNQLLCQSINLAHHQPYVDRFQQPANLKQVIQENGTRLTEDWRNETNNLDKYNDHRDEYLQLL